MIVEASKKMPERIKMFFKIAL